MRIGLVMVVGVLLLAGCAGKSAAVTTLAPALHATTYVLAKTGFAVTYDSRVLKVEIDESGPSLGEHFTQVHFVSKFAPQHLKFLPTSSDMAEVSVSKLGPDQKPVATLLKEWVKSGRPFGSTPDVRWHMTTLNGMPGVTYNVKVSGARLVEFILYSGGHEIDIRVVATSRAPATVWPALRNLAQSVRATQ
jgi:hypothetical protein